MPLSVRVRCPKCTSTTCRESKWRSHREKLEHPGARPWRCEDCAHRFMEPERVTRRATPVIAVLALGVVGVLGLLLGALAYFSAAGGERTDSAELTPAPPTAELSTAAQAGDVDAQYRLGRALLQESALGRDTAGEAVRWLQAAADQGHAPALVQLGRLYRSGVGVLQNFERAAQALQAAAGLGNAEGMVELGRLYRDGIGVAVDPVRAYVWFNRAAAALNSEAVHERESVARLLSAEQLKTAQRLSAPGDDVAVTAGLR